MATPNAEEEPHTSHPHFVRSLSSPGTSKKLKISSNKETDWILRTFKKRDCCYFVPAKKSATDEETSKCKCGRIQKSHKFLYALGDYEDEWTSRANTIKSSTDAYGELEFQGAWTTTRSKYVRVSDDVKAQDLLRLLTKQWGVEHPKLLIEVTGGAKNFVMQPKLRRIFRHGIIKAATSTNAWILTGGTNTGVMKYVGEALHEHSLRSQHRIVAIGVASWGIVHNRLEMIKKGQTVNYPLISSLNTKGASLDPNHTHLILVDDGTEGQYGSDIPVRSDLVKLMAQTSDYAGDYNDIFVDRSIPAVCVVLGGGLNTIKVVLKNISSDPIIPCVVVNGSGMGADLMALAYTNSDQNGKLSEDCISDLKSKIVEAFPNNTNKHAGVLRDLKRIAKKKGQLTVYSADNEGDIDHAILNALHKATNLSPPRQLRLSLNWNRVDVAEDIFKQTTQWDEHILYECFQIALSFNRVGFAGLLMEQAIDVGTFLTKDMLEKLYNAQEDKLCPSLSTMYRSAGMKPPKLGEFKMEGIGKVVKHLLGHGLKPFDTKKPKDKVGVVVDDLVSTDNVSDKRQMCFNHLFIWALLTKKFNMAYLMWKRGRESIAKALIGNRLCYSMCKIAEKSYSSDAVNQQTEQRKRYEQLAINLLDKCYKEDATYTRHLLRAELSKWNHHTCLTLGAVFELTRFIAHPAIQVLLNDHWLGRLDTVVHPKRFQQQMLSEKEEKDKMITSSHSLDVIGYDPGDMIEMGATSGIKQEHQVLLQHFLMSGEDRPDEEMDADLIDTDDEALDDLSDSEDDAMEEQLHRPLMWELQFYQTPETSFEKLKELLQAPVVKFWVDQVFYLIFLTLFTYVVLNSRYAISAVELLVALFMFSFAMEEIRQIFFPDIAMYDLPLKTKLYIWAYDFWNVADILGITLFSCGFGLRVADYVYEDADRNIMLSARILYCLSVMVWYIRLLDIFSVSESMGPYVNMIFKMGKDALSFGMIALVFMLSYGVVRGALLSPNDTVINIFAIPYWQFYGELFLDDDGRMVCGNEECEPEATFVYIVLGIYLLIGNVVLLNMLIAIFNNTFERVKVNADEIWKYQRYRLIMVYSNRPLLPPPFILLAHIWMVVRFVIRSCSKGGYLPVHAMKMHFGDTTTQLLYNFEETCMEDYLRQQNIQGQYSMEGTMQRIGDRVETFAMVLEEQQSIEGRYFRQFASRLDRVETVTRNMMKALTEMKADRKSTDM